MRKNITGKIDHTLLKADARSEEVIRYCEEAKLYGFASVVVNSVNLPLVVEHLKGTGVRPVAVIGFPLGASLTSVKVFETQECVRLGAVEIDMVINIGALKSGNFDEVKRDIVAVVQAAKPATVKVIIETCLLEEFEKVIACELVVGSGAAYIKTSTGFSSAGASISDVLLLKELAKDKIHVKASGGIRSYEESIAFIEAGADRLGIGDGKVVL